MKKKSWHLSVRPNYFRSNFDMNKEGPYNRLNRNSNAVEPNELVVDESDLEEIKVEDIEMKVKDQINFKMITDEEKYPDPSLKRSESPIFNTSKEQYEKIYTTRQKELEDLYKRDRETALRMRVIKSSDDEPKGRKKLAVIRGEEIRECPFGLPIIDACQNAGDAISRLAPLSEFEDEEQREKIKKANRITYAYHKEGKRCPFADKILKEHDKVNCDFGDTGEGQSSTAFRGSPLYPSTFYGIGLDGLYGYPLGFYADNNESRNLFFGLFSLLGWTSREEMVKLANQYDESGEEEKADIVDELLKKMEKLKEEYKDTFDKLEKYLLSYRQKYEKDRIDTGLLWELTDAWLGPRQINR